MGTGTPVFRLHRWTRNLAAAVLSALIVTLAVGYVLAPAGYALTVTSRPRATSGPGVVVYGTVKAQGGEGLAGARVSVSCRPGEDDEFFLFRFFRDRFGSGHHPGFVASTLTGPDGTYQISGVPSGEECTVVITDSVHHHLVTGSVRLHTHDHHAYEVDATLAHRDFFFFAPISSY